MASRRDQIASGLRDVHARVRTACERAGRDPHDVTTVVVTKTFPVSDIRDLLGLGVHDVGENRDQEARRKAVELAQPGPGLTPPHWHFIGQLQRNKANSVARYADYVHSVDRTELAGALQRGAVAAQRELGCFVQVSLDQGDAGVIGPRGGATADRIIEVCEAVERAENLTLLGLMAVAPLDEPPAPAFERLAEMHDAVTREFPAATALSAGMSHDFETAISYGATHVRVGSAVLGERTDVR
ncbi:MAG: YggS family pyridoxal phosphate-dependent enzyme [Actinobacteria bacterium]|nr:YggS family pyridoxal phosphate-dependent enzyme [Actinomycetota bacterium]